MHVPDELRYTNDHEWVRVEGGRLIVGITDFAQSALGDIVYVERPALDTAIEVGGTVGEIESTKSVSEVYAPVSGRIVAVNDAVTEHPELVNTEPYGGGWLFAIEADDNSGVDALLDAEAYRALIDRAVRVLGATTSRACGHR